MDHATHYSDFDLIRYLKGSLNPEVVSEMERHFSRCAECRERCDVYRKLCSLVNSSALEPPDEWIEESVRHFHSAQPSDENPPQIIAELTYDSFTRESEAVRSGGLEERHARFQSADFEVNVLLQTGSGVLQSVVGQLHAKNSAREGDVKNVEAELRVGNRTRATHTNECGEFLFGANTPVTGDPVEIRFRFKEGPCLSLILLC